ncbi:MAG: hypothetical protein QM759_02085 [Terricaulis sp.]
MMQKHILAAALLTLAACATGAPPRYAAATGPSSSGYVEQQIETNRYSVTFRAPSGAEAGALQDYAMLRAADLTLSNNHDWFWVDRRALDDEGMVHSGPSIGFGFGGASFGRHTAVGTGIGINVPIGGHDTHIARAATVDIRFGSGPKPDDANAYDARSTAAAIRTRLHPQ